MKRLHLKAGADLDCTPNLKAAIEKGITARDAKTKADKRRGGSTASKKEEGDDRVWLKASASRLKTLLAFASSRRP